MVTAVGSFISRLLTSLGLRSADLELLIWMHLLFAVQLAIMPRLCIICMNNRLHIASLYVL